jgi:antitoxin MazE
MPISTQIARWGNSLGLRLPKAIASEARLVEGEEVELSVQDGAIVIRAARPSYSLQELTSKITGRNRHGATTWGKPAGREEW